MQYVNPAWLKKYAYALMAFDIVVLLIFAIKLIGFPLPLAKLGVNEIVVIGSFVHMLYVLLIYPTMSRRWVWPASMISASLFGIVLGASASIGEPALHFRLAFILFCVFNTMIGTFLPIATLAFAWAIFGMQLSTGSEKQPLITFITLIISSIATTIGWLILRSKYVDESTIRTTTLNQRLRKEQDITEMLLNSITDGVIITDPKGTVTSINDGAATILGWTKKDAQGLDYRSLIQAEIEPGQDASMKLTAIDACHQSGKPEQKISLLKTPTDHRLYVDIVASPIVNPQKAGDDSIQHSDMGVIAVLRNVDQQKKEQQQRSDFISTASHEMRTPVASIQGFVELALNNKVSTIDDKARGYLEKAHEATKHLGKLFQDLLTVSRSEDGRLSNNPKLIEVGEFLSELVEQDRPTAEKKGLKLVYESGNNPDNKAITPLLYVNVDPERLREVILNLLDNAIKYTATGMITVGASLKDSSVLIRVSDTGMGIPAEDIPHLFQKFYRTDNSATREIGGTGLGLYICKQIIDVMGGKIWTESTLGAGSTFYVELPRVSPDQIEALIPAP